MSNLSGYDASTRLRNHQQHNDSVEFGQMGAQMLS